MPTKAERRAPLPAGLVPLLTQRELETYYGVSDWTVLQWIKAGMPVVTMRPARSEKAARGGRPEREIRRFDLAAVQRWHASGDELAATA